jgi:hypothetical protein
MFAHVSHILSLTNIHRERLLPVPGRVLARKGQKVSPADIMAQATLAPEHVVLDIARGLGLSAKDADHHIQRKAGEDVGEGDVIAGPVGLARRVVRAPRTGKVIIAGDGQVLLQLESRPFELKAGLRGTVTDLIPDRGVIIETTGALIQGVWGNRRLDFGLLSVKLTSPDEELTTNQLDISMRGSVVLGGHCEDERVIRMADDLPLRGLILSSMSSALVPDALNARFPIILLEGFGRLPMNQAAFKLLSTSDRREITLQAGSWEGMVGSRPELIITLPAEQQQLHLSPDADQFRPGQQIRVLRAPHLGKTGELVSVMPELSLMPNGIRTAAASVRLLDEQIVTAPLVNLEVID